jgi:uncharacterized protein
MAFGVKFPASTTPLPLERPLELLTQSLIPVSSEFDRSGLLIVILEQFRINRQGSHGPNHWARVRKHGLSVGGAVGADLLVVELFAFLHDSQRENEYSDPSHGARAAAYAQSLNGTYFSIAPEQLEKLCLAMTDHSEGKIHQDPTIQTCWDADRLDLGRVGTKPRAKYLSAEGAKYIESAYAWSIR